MSYDAFDELPSADYDLDPIHVLDRTKEEDLLKWANDNYNFLLDTVQARAAWQIRNQALYKGQHYASQDRYANFRNIQGVDVSSETSKVVINELYEYSQQRKARLARFETMITTVPHSNEHSDKEGAEAAKQILDTIASANDFSAVKRRADEECPMFGESYIMPIWDECKGGIDPRWEKARDSIKKQGKRNVRQKVKVSGVEFEYDPEKPKFLGDFAIRHVLPWQLLIEPFKLAPDVQWFIYWSYHHVEDLKKRYRDVADKIVPTGSATTYNEEQLTVKNLTRHALVLEVWGRSTEFLPNGIHWIQTPEVLLKKPVDNPYRTIENLEFGNLPLERLTDIDVQGEFHGYPTYQLLAGPQHLLNQMVTMAARNVKIAGHPKLMVPRQGKINHETFGSNEITVVSYNHPYKPHVETVAVVPPEVLALAELMSKKMTMLGGIQPISQGDIPSNVRSGRAIRLLEELESMRATDMIKKAERFMLNLYKRALSIVGDNYKKDEKRLIKILGEDKKYQIDSFNTVALENTYDVELVPSSSLPQTPSARLATVMEMAQIPAIVESLPRELIIESMQLGTPEKLYSAITASVDKAGWENQMFIKGKIPPEPIDGDNDVVHWAEHNKILCSKSFLEFSKEIQEEMIDHQRSHEMGMMDKANMNPVFLQRIMQLPGFPKFYHQPSIMPPADPSQLPPPSGGGVQGSPGPVGGSAPGTPGADLELGN